MQSEEPTPSQSEPFKFYTRFVDALPGDPLNENTLRQVHEACYSLVSPTPTQKPRIRVVSKEVADILGLTEDDCKSAHFVNIFSGNHVQPGMKPFAACYGGHQFGHWAGQLGDGRAIALGGMKGPDGAYWEMQLKGAGPTPYSRSADGRAVLRSSVREFLCSEAMHHLGVPTTRALSLMSTGDDVVRDILYDGHPRPEPGAIVCRVSPSFLRFGNFEIFSSRQEYQTLTTLAEFTLQTFFPHLGEPCPDSYAAMFGEVCERTARMVIEWMRVGFVHGVMNTDNMSILGLTIDYGPYGWIDNFDLTWTPNTTDRGQRRYRFGAQPPIALWNLQRLGEALYPLVESEEKLQDGLLRFVRTFEKEHHDTWIRKLGLENIRPDEYASLISDLMDVLQEGEVDMTLFFRGLAHLSAQTSNDEESLLRTVEASLYEPSLRDKEYQNRLSTWLTRYHEAVKDEGVDPTNRLKKMNRVNPKYVLRNYLAQLAIEEAENGDDTKLVELLDVMRRPYDEQPNYEAYAEKRPDWARHKPGCSMLSCSS